MNYQLPDTPNQTDLESFMASDEEIIWNSVDLAAWRKSFAGADWLDGWIKRMQARFHDALPELMRKGLRKRELIPAWMRTGAEEPLWLERFLSASDMARTWFEEGFLEDDPLWLTRLMQLEEANVARSFLISGNISDYAFDPARGYRHSMRLLITRMLHKKDCVMTYRLSRGLSVESHDPLIRQRLPQALLAELDSIGIHHEISLLTEVCRLFDVLNRWLTRQPNTDGDRDSGEFIKGVAVVIENIHLLLPPHQADIEHNYLIDHLLYWSNSPELLNSSHCLILTAESLEDVSAELRFRGGKIEQIIIPRPEDSRSRLKFILPLLDPKSGMQETRVSRMSCGLSQVDGYAGTYLERLRELSHDTAGLNFIGIEDLIQQSLTSASKSLTRTTVMNLKRERLKRESDGILELVDPQFTLEAIGGYAALKKRLREIISALRLSRNRLVRSTVPMGILLLGPPGTGKSLIAEAIAGESGINMVRLGDFRGMYVGQSEQNLSRIFSLIDALHPVIVFIDEIDQALGKRSLHSGDSGVDNRIFGRFLEFISNPRHRGKILWIGASNFPEKIDPAMKRAGRFDLVLPVLLPDKESRYRIIRILLEQELFRFDNVKHKLADEIYQTVAERTQGFSGAELRTIVGEVIRQIVSFRLKGETITLNSRLFDEVLSSYCPPKTQRENYRLMEQKAIQDVSFIDLLPHRTSP